MLRICDLMDIVGLRPHGKSPRDVGGVSRLMLRLCGRIRDLRDVGLRPSVFDLMDILLRKSPHATAPLRPSVFDLMAKVHVVPVCALAGPPSLDSFPLFLWRAPFHIQVA